MGYYLVIISLSIVTCSMGYLRCEHVLLIHHDRDSGNREPSPTGYQTETFSGLYHPFDVVLTAVVRWK